MYHVNHMPRVVELGTIGDNYFKTIQIDLTPWLRAIPRGVASIIHIRPGETEDDAYIAATDVVNGILMWEPASGDLGETEGYGSMQIWLEDAASNRGKSVTVQTYVRASIVSPGETPEPQENWMEQMTALKVETVENAEDAADSAAAAADAKDAAEEAQALAEAARDAAQAAAGEFQGITAEAATLDADEDATVEVTHSEGGLYNFGFGIPKGTTFTPNVNTTGDLSWTNDGGKTNPETVNIKGPQGDPAPAATVTAAVDAYLEENFTNPSNPPLDRTLSSNASAAPADMVGDLKSAFEDSTGVTIMDFESGYWNTKDVGNIINPASRTSSGNYVSAIAPFEVGDNCIVNVAGGGGAKAWAYLDANYTVLSSSAGNAVLNNTQTPLAPTGTKYIVIQNMLSGLASGYYARLGKYPKSEIAGVKDAINLFNVSDLINGYISDNGGIVLGENWRTAFKVPVKGAKRLVLSGGWFPVSQGGLNNIWCYNADGVSLGGCFNSAQNEEQIQYVDLLTGTEYVSICNTKTNVEHGASAVPVSLITMLSQDASERVTDELIESSVRRVSYVPIDGYGADNTTVSRPGNSPFIPRPLIEDAVITGLKLKIDTVGVLSFGYYKSTDVSAGGVYDPEKRITITEYTFTQTGEQTITFDVPLYIPKGCVFCIGANTDTGKLLDGSYGNDKGFFYRSTSTALTFSNSNSSLGVTIYAVKNDIYSTQRGKKLSIYGDSISTFEGWNPEGNAVYYHGEDHGVQTVNDTWWMKTINALQYKLLVNNSWSGRAVSNISDGTTEHATNAGYKEANVLQLKDGNVLPDVIIVKLGINDFNRECPLGTYDGRTALPTDPSTFTNAYAIMLNLIMTNFPLAKVYCCTLTSAEKNGSVGFPEINGNNESLTEWNNAIRQLAGAFGASVLDHSSCGLTYYNMSTYMGDWNSTAQTGLHPNAKGHSLIANQTIHEIDNAVRTRYR